jgi:hypothetical protein
VNQAQIICARRPGVYSTGTRRHCVAALRVQLSVICYLLFVD